ncbi:MAG: hypothetical protein AB1457_08985 [Chloroflexota bacterium]|nr:MAG: hypothetical protein KatS3mg045_0552 [Bellilinea sp.]
MEIFNVGFGELLFIFLLALILLGPDGMKKAGLTIAKGVRAIIRSPFWKIFMDTTREIREMPTILVREAGLEEFNEKTRKSLREFSEELPKEMDLSDDDLKQLDPRLKPIPWEAPPPASKPPSQDEDTNPPGEDPTPPSTDNKG